MFRRKSGILLHPTSLPGPGGIGSFGPEARRFVDFLLASGQSLWQVLPLGPPGAGESPYSCFSAFAGNPLLIDLDAIAADGDLPDGETSDNLSYDSVDFKAVGDRKLSLLRDASQRFFANAAIGRMEEFWCFCNNSFWLHDYALYMALKLHFNGKPWNRWPEKLRKRGQETREEFSSLLGEEIGFQKYMQWQFSKQWHSLKLYANERGIQIIGDAPIFVALDSADVWCNQHLFRLDENGGPLVVAGVPPDYFSRTGQRWGNPLYDWHALAVDSYGWWIARMKNDFALYDLVRIDHFRGFEACWEIPAAEKTAVRGRWVKGPGTYFFDKLLASLGSLPIIAEDLGVITPEVETLRDRFALPGMKILQFAFDGGPSNGYLPHNHISNCVVYTGTHDNDTTRGWFDSLPRDKQQEVCRYLRASKEDVVDVMLRTAMASTARYSIVPLQDLLELDGSARMNVPGVAEGNWRWRLAPGALTPAVAEKMRLYAIMYNRFCQQ